MVYNVFREIFNQDALILAPISKDDNGSLEQTYSLLQYSNSKFNVLNEIMKTSFSLRVDKKIDLDKSLD